MPSRLCLHNTLTGRKEIFKPADNHHVKIFTCGPSIYDWPHIGNYRTFLYEDILQRYLEYSGYEVERMINFTDVEDKAIERARKKGISLDQLTQPVADAFLQSCRILKIKLPADIPRSSTTVEAAAELTRALMEKGYAYRHGQDVYYDPLKFKGFGKLYGLDMSKWPKKKVRFGRDTYPGQRWNLGDFILWKGGRCRPEDDACWDTPLGQGRPSWNIQDPAMISSRLGFQVDISCGGVDNLYRHHDYIIAIMEGVSGKPYAQYWLHGEHVLSDGKKMSKSRGNILYIKDLLTSGYLPHHLRFFLIYGHYREKMNVCDDQLQLARGKIDTFADLACYLKDNISTYGGSEKAASHRVDRIRTDFEKHMNDDLNVRAAFDATYENLKKLVQFKTEGKLKQNDCERALAEIKRIDQVWQVLSCRIFKD